MVKSAGLTGFALVLLAGAALAEPLAFTGASAGAAGPGPDDRSWHLLTQTEGGTVSLLKGLTKHECDFSRARALGLPATDEEIAAEQAALDAAMAKSAAQRKADGCDTNPNKMACIAVSMGVAGSVRMVGPGDIRSAECFQ